MHNSSATDFSMNDDNGIADNQGDMVAEEEEMGGEDQENNELKEGVGEKMEEEEEEEEVEEDDDDEEEWEAETERGSKKKNWNHKNKKKKERKRKQQRKERKVNGRADVQRVEITAPVLDDHGKEKLECGCIKGCHIHGNNGQHSHAMPWEDEQSRKFLGSDIRTVKKVKNIIRTQFDVEIENRKRDVRLIDYRIGECNDMMRRLQDAWRNRGSHRTLKPKKKENKRYRSPPPVAKKKHATDAASGGGGTKNPQSKRKKPDAAAHTPPQQEPPKRPKKKIRIAPEAGPLYARKPDGSFVQLFCPSCKRAEFLNLLGFSNHCRILHKIKFATWTDAITHCGVPVDESVIPPEHPCRATRPIGFPFGRLPLQAPSHAIPGQQQQQSEQGLMNPPSAAATTTTTTTAHSTGTIVTSLPARLPFPSSVRSELPEEQISRFKITKRVIVGNTSKHIPLAFREGDDKATHKWMVYVRGTEKQPDISSFVRKVRFFLHPSFEPNDLVDVVMPPFHLTRRGWGEFPVRVQLHFVDPRNKPVDIIHTLKLDHSNSGLQMLGGETPMDVELVRDFDDDDDDSQMNEISLPDEPPSRKGEMSSREDEEERRISRELNKGVPAPGGSSGKGKGKGKGKHPSVPPAAPSESAVVSSVTAATRSAEPIPSEASKTPPNATTPTVTVPLPSPITPPTAAVPKPSAPTAPKPSAPAAPKPSAPTAPKPSAPTAPKPSAPPSVTLSAGDTALLAKVKMERPPSPPPPSRFPTAPSTLQPPPPLVSPSASPAKPVATPAVKASPSLLQPKQPPPVYRPGNSFCAGYPLAQLITSTGSSSTSTSSSTGAKNVGSLPALATTTKPASLFAPSTPLLPPSLSMQAAAPQPTSAAPPEDPPPPPIPDHIPPNIHCVYSLMLPQSASMSVSELEEVEDLLHEGSSRYPVIAPDRHSSTLPYMFAKSEEEWVAMNIGRRKASEWQRARLIQSFIKEKCKTLLPLKTILVWSRDKGLVPEVAIIDEAAYFCKYCGAAHLPPEQFKTEQKLCKQRAKGSVNTYCTFLEMFSTPIIPTATTIDPSHDNSHTEWKRELLASVEQNQTPLFPTEWVHKEMSDLGIATHDESTGVASVDDVIQDEEASENRRAVAMVAKAAGCFLKVLMKESVAVYAEQREQEIPDTVQQRVLVPLHVFRAIQRKESMDFLTNCGLKSEILAAQGKG